MTLARIFLLASSIFVVATLSAQPAHIEGSLSPIPQNQQLVLTHINYDTRLDKKIQDVAVSADGRFAFDIPLTDAAIYTLTAGKSVLLHFLAKPGDEMKLSIINGAVSVTGSPDTQALADYEEYRKKIFNKWLKPAYDSADVAAKSGDKARIEYWSRAHEQASVQYKQELSQWVVNGNFKNSLAAVHHSLRWHADNDLAVMDTLAAIAKRTYPDALLSKQLQHKVQRAKSIALGATAPNFSIPDVDGKTVTLQQLRGKYVLVDFWASWCAPCRQENPNLVKMYEKYHPEGFEIVSISIDEHRDRWLKAIAKDGLVWINASELQGYGSPVAALYSVTAIPNSFLLDPSGRIVSKNLKGNDLDNKLKSLLMP